MTIVSKSSPRCQGTVVLLSLLVASCATCGCGDGQPSAADQLLRRQRERELTEAERPLSFDESLEAAEHEFKLQNFESVRDMTERLLSDRPNDGRALVLAAQAEKASGDLDAAAALLDLIPLEDPMHTAAARVGAKWFAESGDYDTAINRLFDLRDRTMAKRRDLHQLAALLNNAGRRIEAAGVLEELLRVGDVSEKELFSLITLGSPFIDDTRPKPNFERGLVPAALARARILRDTDVSEAITLTEQLYEAFPNSSPIYAFLTRLTAEVQDWDRLEQLIPFRPDDIKVQPEFWYAVGLLLQQRDDHRPAVGCFREAIALDQTDRFSFLQLARSLNRLGRAELSDQMMRRYELLDESSRLIRKIGNAPGSTEQLNRLAEILDEMQRPLEAIEWRLIAARQQGRVLADIERLNKLRETILLNDSNNLAEQILVEFPRQEWPLPNLDAIGLNSMSRQPLKTGSDRVIRLNDIADQVGLSFQFVNRHPSSDQPLLIYHLNGGGIGVLDFDCDGWPDWYFTQAGGPPLDSNGSLPNELFRNLAGRKVGSVTQSSGTGDRGFGQGVSVGDLNQDGFPDLLVANLGHNLWYRNQGDGTFARHLLSGSKLSGSNLGSRQSPVENPDRADATNERVVGQWTTSIACGDLSGDGLPEIVSANYSDDPRVYRLPCLPDGDYCSPLRFRAAADHLLTLQADGSIVEWNGGTAADHSPGHGFGLIIGNIDQRVGNELLIVNDTDVNHYWKRQEALELPDSSGLPDGATADDGIAPPPAMRETAQLYGLASGVSGNRQGCMGLAHGDFDRNGQMDFHVTNYWAQPSDLYLQQVGGFFQNASTGRGLGSPSLRRVGWGTQSTDLDRDGWLDIVVLNGHVVDSNNPETPYKMLPQLFRGGASAFDLVAGDGSDYWSRPALGRTLATLDWNRDGKMDFLANHLDVPAALLQNDTEIGNWIRFELVGTDSERDAVGATIRIEVEGESWTGWMVGGDGFQCKNESVVDFGIGERSSGATVEIHWPSGTTQRFNDVPLNARYLVIEGQSGLVLR